MLSRSGGCFPEQYPIIVKGANMIKMFKNPSLCMLIIAGLTLLFSPISLYAWEPKKPVEFVIMACKGGGADKMARLMQTVIEEKGWSSMLTPINKPYGSGAEHWKTSKTGKRPEPYHHGHTEQFLYHTDASAGLV